MLSRQRGRTPTIPVAGERRGVVASYFLLFLGAGVYLPYLPRWLEDLGWSGWQIGVVVGVQPWLRWTSAIAWAWIADRRRMRHRVLLGCGIAGAVALAPLLVVRDFAGVAVVLSAVALLHGPIVPLLDATVVDNLSRLGGDYGRLRLWGSVSFILGALGSAPLVDLLGPRVVPVMLFLLALPLGAVFARLPRSQLGHDAGLHAPWRLIRRPLGAFLLAAFLVQASSGAWTAFFAVHTAALGLPDVVPGIAWGLAVVGEIALFRWSRRVLEAIAPARLLVLVVLLTSVRWALTAWVRDGWAVVALQLGHMVTFSTFHLAAQVLLSRLVPPESTSSGQALYGLSGFGLGGTVGIVLAGLLIDRVGTSGVFAIEAVVALTALVPAWRLLRSLP